MTRLIPERSLDAQRGLTLVELMIATALSGLLMSFVLGSYVRTSAAYRDQTVLGGLTQTLRGAADAIRRDVRRAGFQLTRFRVATGAFGSTIATDLSPLWAINNASGGGPDALRVYYADSSLSTGVANDVSEIVGDETITVLDPTGFEEGDIVSLSLVRIVTGASGNLVAEHDACILEITAISGTSVTFDDASTYNAPDMGHCAIVIADLGGGDVSLSRFVGRAYRLDPARPELGVLQLSPSGELNAGDWQDVALGYTDLQLATRFLELNDALDRDGDGDPTRDWYSAEAQEFDDTSLTRPAGAIPVNVTLSLAARTGETGGAGTAQTPAFIDANNVAHNALGDHASVAAVGNRLYRSHSQLIDIRNLGVGQ